MNSSSSERGGAQMPNARLYSSIDIPEVINRNSAARDIVAGFATAAPTLSPAWRAIQTALADARDLAAELARLSGELAAARLDRANAVAAMRATLAADARRGTRPPVLPARRTERVPGSLPGPPGGIDEQLPADAPERPAGAPRGHAAHDGHQLR